LSHVSRARSSSLLIRTEAKVEYWRASCPVITIVLKEFALVFIIKLTSSHHDIPTHVFCDVPFVVLLQNLPPLVPHLLFINSC
jgi:hypothetical protein